MDTNTQEIYRAVFKEYPDVMNVREVSSVLGVSTKTVYRELKRGKAILGKRDDVVQQNVIGARF